MNADMNAQNSRDIVIDIVRGNHRDIFRDMSPEFARKIIDKTMRAFCRFGIENAESQDELERYEFDQFMQDAIRYQFTFELMRLNENTFTLYFFDECDYVFILRAIDIDDLRDMRIEFSCDSQPYLDISRFNFDLNSI